MGIALCPSIEYCDEDWRERKSPMEITLTVNEISHRLVIGDQSHQTSPSETLAQTLREKLGLTGTKIGCDQGSCGSCTVLMDGAPVLSCMILTVECDGKHITTIEGLGDTKTGQLDPLQQAFIDHTAYQCGFCTPGVIMGSKALLNVMGPWSSSQSALTICIIWSQDNPAISALGIRA